MPKEKKSPRPNQEAEIARLKAEYLIYYEKLPVQRLAAASVGRDENTIIDWRNKDPDFRDACLRARANWALKKTNSSRVRDEFLLERIMKDDFSPKVEVESNQPGVVNITYVLPQHSDSPNPEAAPGVAEVSRPDDE